MYFRWRSRVLRSVLLPSDTVESVVPTAANPFYNLPEWEIDIKS